MSVKVLEAFEGLENGSVAVVLRRTVVPQYAAETATAVSAEAIATATALPPTEADPLTREYLDQFDGSVWSLHYCVYS